MTTLQEIAKCQTSSECPARPLEFYRGAFDLLVTKARAATDTPKEAAARAMLAALKAINADQSLYGAWAMEASISGDEFNRRAGVILGIRAAIAQAKAAGITTEE